MTEPALIGKLRAALGDVGVITAPEDVAPYAQDWRRLYQGRTAAVVRPASTAELAEVVRLCAEAGVAVVPQGGNTSMVGGAVPTEDGREIVVSLARMNRMRALDPVDLTHRRIEAGVTLKAAQDAAAEAGCLLPLSISSEGTAQIGGVLATNAGGNNTVRYGNARDLVLGLEVVLPDGSVWNGLRRLRKDNTGYCLRQLFVGVRGHARDHHRRGAEAGAAAASRRRWRCAPCRRRRRRWRCSRGSSAHDPASVRRSNTCPAPGMGFVLRHISGSGAAAGSARATLCAGGAGDAATGCRAARGAGGGTGAGAGSGRSSRTPPSRKASAQRAAIWKLREEHSEAQKREGASVKNDVSVPVSQVPEFIRRATAACEALMPGIRVVPFGHMGDGNIHFNLEQPVGMDAAAFLAQDHAIMDAVNEVVRELDGSFSAEHGIGKLKPYMMPDWRGGAELTLMQRIKRGD